MPYRTAPSPAVPPTRRRKILDWIAAPVARAFRAIALAGTAGYPPDTVRRLKILNVIAALIALTNSIYALQLAITDYATMEPVVWLNLVLAALAASVPFAHRINDTAGGLLLVAAELLALYGFTAYFGRSGGAPMQYVVAAAAPFVIFGLERLWLVIAIVVTALTLHLAAWFSFTRSNALLHVDRAMLDSLYMQGAITTFGLIAASVYYAFSLAERAKAETDTVLRNVLPDSVVERLKSNPDETIFDGFASASILFADITGFVGLARTLGPEKTVALLNRLVSSFDALAQHHGVEKIKTIGDAYMVASGVPLHRPDHLTALASMALDMLDAAKAVAADTGLPLNIRIGMASGPMMAGVIGTKKFSYDVWGDPVNLASRLESASEPGRILVCPLCFDALEGLFKLESRGRIDVKGVGQQEAWYLTARL
ncbi:MAG: adenylate/guanylate cyclase domain-containing protein [Hyphomicrobium sp.]|nr:adenylate/guanylate cyclase domain-containing protein [Hyphomicrobium sp.]